MYFKDLKNFRFLKGKLKMAGFLTDLITGKKLILFFKAATR